MALNLPGMDPERYTLKEAKSIDPTVRQVIAQEVQKRLEKERRTKLTWSSPDTAWKQRGVADPNWVGMPIGTDGFDMKLPYMSYNGEYFVQNCRIYLSNGTRITLEEVPNYPIPGHECPRCRKRGVACSPRDYVESNLETWKKQAVERDPMLCRYCYDFTADTPDEYADHLAVVHADRLGQRLGFGNATPESGSSSGSSVPSSEGRPVVTTRPASPPFADRRAVEEVVIPAEASGTQSDLEKAYSVPAGTMTAVTMPGPIPVSTVKPAAKVEPKGQFICGEKDCGRVFEKASALKRHHTYSHTSRG